MSRTHQAVYKAMVRHIGLRCRMDILVGVWRHNELFAVICWGAISQAMKSRGRNQTLRRKFKERILSI